MRVEGLRSHGLGPVDLSIEAGSCVCLSGPSGVGKSLLLRAMADLDPHEGEVWLEGRPCREFPPADWRRQVALLSAESQWWHDRTGDHFPVVDEAGLASLGFGPEVMGWQVARCSTGERQRLAVLRLLANRPRVLLLDEPTASLDPDGVGRVEAMVAEYRQANGAAVLWVSHSPEQIARVADRHLRVEAGRVTEVPLG